jgi:hypothetical protein
VQAGIPCDNYIPLHVFLLGRCRDVIVDGAVELPLLEDVPFVYYLSYAATTPMMRADFSIMILLFTLSWW